ncbi:N-acetylmuramoyl-L-alanine amidase [Pseudaminobacter sp. NGMCC 1.201702]|uniref:N-acetylmuramoyl-L-alanine amidase n=1 Tax=Pseudaminobacter sp. NGMCC 1.201702 TaxID=3391825 RepID=UPI0039EE8ACA
MSLADIKCSGVRSGISPAAIGRLLIFAVSLILMSLSQASSAPLEARDYKMAGDATHMRVVMNFDREPEPKWFLLRGPHRLVIDLGQTKFTLDAKELKARGLVTNVRYGQLDEETSRLILTSKGPFTIEKLDVLQNEDTPGYRLVIDMAAASERQFEEALGIQAQTTGSTETTPTTDRLGKAAAPHNKRFTVVIDPGHGGIDGGAEGLNGTVEKSITLAFALELRAKLAQSGPYNVYMTRERDQFLRLDERVRIAREHEADLFISIHADTIRLKGIRGATVYTLSDRASDAEAQALADRENLSDQLAGIEIEEEKQEVADILVDLIRRETHGFSMSFARSLIGELESTVGLINNPHRFAGFRVLKAPDVPSVLVELGYLSNPEDEEQLRDPDWRGKAADSIANAVAAFAAAKMAAGG